MYGYELIKLFLKDEEESIECILINFKYILVWI